MRSSYRARAAVGVATLLLAFGVAGCEDEDPADPIESTGEPIPPYSSSPTEPTTSTDTGPVEPALPAEAEAETKAGAEAFVRYYFAVINYATASGDVARLATLDQPSCSGCEGGIDFVERVYEHDGRILGGRYRILSLDPERSPSGYWSVIVRTYLDEQKVVGAGDLNETYPGGRAQWLVGMTRFQGSWSVTTLDIL